MNTLNVIFGSDAAAVLEKNMTVLELDTFMQDGLAEPITSYAVIENIPFDEMMRLEQSVRLHRGLMQEYRTQNWDYCDDALTELTGCWNHVLDDFYIIMKARVDQFRITPPSAEWDSVVYLSPDNNEHLQGKS